MAAFGNRPPGWILVQRVKSGTISRYLFGLLVAAATVSAFWVPPAKGFQNTQLARILFFHLPCAIATPIFLFFGSWLSVRYLATKDIAYDIRAAAANELGFVLALLTMATGI